MAPTRAFGTTLERTSCQMMRTRAQASTLHPAASSAMHADSYVRTVAIRTGSHAGPAQTLAAEGGILVRALRTPRPIPTGIPAASVETFPIPSGSKQESGTIPSCIRPRRHVALMHRCRRRGRHRASPLPKRRLRAGSGMPHPCNRRSSTIARCALVHPRCMQRRPTEPRR